MLTETEIVQGLIEKKEYAVETMVKIYGDRLLRTAAAITGDPHTAEEIVQDTFLQICRKIGTFKGQSSFQTWMLRITVNYARNSMRSSWLRRAAPWNEAVEQTSQTSTNDPFASFLQEEERKVVLRSLQLLPVKYREVLVLYYYEELNVKEISSILEQPEGTVKSKLARGRNLLKKQLIEKEVVFNE